MKFKNFFRHPKTRNEMKQNADPEIKKFVRPKRTKQYLPTVWNDIIVKTYKSWKDNSKKKHSWEK